MMRFFELGAETGYAYPSRAWGYSVYKDEPCPACGESCILHMPGPGIMEVDGPRRWPDAMSNIGHAIGFIVSERVVKAMKQAGITGFVEFPVRIEQVHGQARRANTHPDYFHLHIYGQTDLDYQKSGIRVSKFCPVCFSCEQREGLVQFAPLYDTWDGSDLFQFRNYPSGFKCCTERLLLLAREHRWTGFRFECIDVIRRHKIHHSGDWRGIDYLGKQWPPQWYPTPPSAGRTFEQWIQYTRPSDAELAAEVEKHIADELRWTESEEGRQECLSDQHRQATLEWIIEARAVKAAEALLDFPEQATPAMLQQLRTGNARERRAAAWALIRLKDEYCIELDEPTRAAIVENWPDAPKLLLA